MRNELLWASWEKQKKKGSNWISTVMQGPRSTFEVGEERERVGFGMGHGSVREGESERFTRKQHRIARSKVQTRWSHEFSRLLWAIAKIAFISTAKIIASLDLISADHVYAPFHISFHRWFIPHGKITTYKWPAPNVIGFIARLAWASCQYREVTGSKSLKSWFFQASPRNC